MGWVWDWLRFIWDLVWVERELYVGGGGLMGFRYGLKCFLGVCFFNFYDELLKCRLKKVEYL